MAAAATRKAAPSSRAAAAAERTGADSGAAPESRGWRWLIPLLLAAVTLAAYWNSFYGVFQFDDVATILRDRRNQQLWPPWIAMGDSTRPLSRLTLAVNYALDGTATRGYHAVNLAIHLLAGLVLYGLARRTLAGPGFDERDRRAAPWLAGTIAGLWLVHPLTTAAVTYIVQRDESLMGLCFLLTLYCGMRSGDAARPRAWTAAAIVACALGMGAKEVMVGAPIVMLLYDRTFMAGSFAQALRRRYPLYAGLAATWLILAVLLLRSGPETLGGLASDQERVTAWMYALTQPGVIVHYLRLAAWPHPLVLDYSWTMVRTIGAAAPSGIVVLALLAATLLALWRAPRLGFLGACFFVILAPTSSIVPIADAAFEHRMYLPLAALVALIVMGVYRALGWAQARLGATDATRRAAGACLAAATIAALAVTTARRNDDYRSALALWADNVVKRPDNPRARYNLGFALDEAGRSAEAIPQYLEAIRLKPDDARAYANLGLALAKQNRLPEAKAAFAEALRLRPDLALAHHGLGTALAREGDLDGAAASFSEALRLNPGYVEALNNLGTIRHHQGKTAEAIAAFEKAVALNPNDAMARNNLGAALGREGRLDEAYEQLSIAVRLKPDFAEARNSLRKVEAARKATGS